MKELLEKLKKYFKANDPVMILNTSTNVALLCLKPEMNLEENEMIFLKFESLNDHGGDSVYIKALQGDFDQTLYFENEVENVLMLQPVTMANYNEYIRKNYTNAPTFQTLEKVKEYIGNQI